MSVFHEVCVLAIGLERRDLPLLSEQGISSSAFSAFTDSEETEEKKIVAFYEGLVCQVVFS